MITTTNHGLLPTDYDVPGLGQIRQVSLTAYRFDTGWVPFAKVHGPHQPATPLASLS